MVSVEGSVVVRTATERFLAELSVVVRLCGWLRRADRCVGGPVRRVREGAHHSTSFSQSGGLGIGERSVQTFTGTFTVRNRWIFWVW